jgi:hypothetical protein
VPSHIVSSRKPLNIGIDSCVQRLTFIIAKLIENGAELVPIISMLLKTGTSAYEPYR